MDNPLTHLHRLIVARYDLDEFRTLCFALSVNYDDLPGETLGGKARELILEMGRRRELGRLLAEIAQDRLDLSNEPILSTDPDALAALYAALPSFEDSSRTALPAPGESPFKGLQYFDQADAHLFFGREKLTSELVQRLQEHSFLGVVGASGSGKSSVVRAGLIPALRCDKPLEDGTLPPDGSVNWPIHLITPTAHPLEALAASLTCDSESVVVTEKLMDDLACDPRSLHLYVRKILSRHDRRSHPSADCLLLVVDQFEELFTRCKNEAERHAFVDNLMTAVACETEGPLVLVITMRADFYAHCAQYPNLREALEKHQAYIGQMSQEELRRAIKEPATRNGWEIEPGLVDLLLRDVGDEPGALPLLSHALLETWKRRRGRMLTLEGYTEAGGVQGAITQTAETVFQQRLTADQQVIARSIFLRLTEFGEGTQDTRRRAVLAELIPYPEDASKVDKVLKELADARLIITSAEAAEVVHEALIRGWPRLQGWINDDRNALRIHRRLTEAASEWEQRNCDEGCLYQGARLADAEEWTKIHFRDLNESERRFLDASQAAAERSRRAEARAANRLRCLVMLLAFAGLVAVLGSIEAGRARREAERQSAISRSQAIAAVAEDQLPVDAERGLLLAMEAISVAHTFEAENALREALVKSHVRAIFSSCSSSTRLCAANDAAWHPDGAWLALALSDGTIQLWNADARHLFKTLKSNADAVNTLSWSPDGEQLAFGSSDGSVRLWDVTDGRIVVLTDHTGSVNALAWSPDGQKLAFVASDNLVHVWNVEKKRDMTTLAGHEFAVTNVTWSPDSRQLASCSSSEKSVRLWDVETGQCTVVLAGHELGITDIAWSPDGRRLASASYDKTVQLWDTETGRNLGILIDHKFLAYIIAWSPDGTCLATGSCTEFDWLSKCLRGEIRLWDVTAGESLATLNGHTGAIFSVAWRPNSTQLASTSSDGTVRLWDAETRCVKLKGVAFWSTNRRSVVE